MKKPYVQFSKKIVIGVTIAVSAIVFIGVVLAYFAEQIEQMTAVIKIYVQYDMVVFVAYSGNSMLQKWLLKNNGFFGTVNGKEEQTDNSEG